LRTSSESRKLRSKKHRTGSDIVVKDNKDAKDSNLTHSNERNISMDVGKQRSIIDLYSGPDLKAIHVKKKSLQYAMKRSKLNRRQQLLNKPNIKLAINKEMRKSSGAKRFKDFRHSSSSLPNAINLVSNLANTRNRKHGLYPYESHKIKDSSLWEIKKGQNLRYDGFKRKYTIFNDSIVVNNNFGIKLSNNYMKAGGKMTQSLDRE
jgi:hypothetical protein